MGFFLLLIIVMKKPYVLIDLNCFSQVSDVAHGPLVICELVLYLGGKMTNQIMTDQKNDVNFPVKTIF